MHEHRTDLWAPLFDAGMALQREWMASTQGMMESALAYQRATLHATAQAIRATDPELWVPRDALERNLGAWVGALPGVSNDTANKVSREIVRGIETWGPVYGRSAREMRDAGLRSVQEMEEILTETSHLAERGVREVMGSLERAGHATREAGKEAMGRMREAAREAGEGRAREEPSAARRGEPEAAEGKSASGGRKKRRKSR